MQFMFILVAIQLAFLWASLTSFLVGAGVAQLVSARPSELEVLGSILGDSNVCFDILLTCVALALNEYP